MESTILMPAKFNTVPLMNADPAMK
jgi:hypothetical protein